MIDQIIIGAAGISTVYLSQSRAHAARKWAAPIGLAAQPAWLYASWEAAQWGIFVLSIVYAIGWARGVYTHWIRP